MMARFVTLLLVLVPLLVASIAQAEVRREGTWPEDEERVSLSIEGQPRSEAIKRLAEEAGWSVVVQAPSKTLVDVHVKDQPASKVLELILADAAYVASRDGTLVSIAPAPAAKPVEAPAAGTAAGEKPAKAKTPAPPKPPAVPKPPEAARIRVKVNPASAEIEPPENPGEDRVVTGGSTRVNADEVVNDLVVLGGSADVFGTVSGDVTVMGGSARVHEGAKVFGDATAVGGSIEIEDGAYVRGETEAVGGKLRRGDNASVEAVISDDAGEHEGWTLQSLASDAGSALTRMALLFVFGAVLLALATRRMEALEVEVAARPMRTFALGIVGSLVGLVALVALCITVIGIPLAVVALLAVVFGAYAGICAVLTAAGAMLIKHRTDNPYVHLALGCALLLVVGAIPWLGGLALFVVVVLGLGTLVATRGAGMLPPRGPRNQGAYRTAAT